MARMNLTPADDLKDEHWGPIGTPERDAMEAQLKEEIHHYFAMQYFKLVCCHSYLSTYLSFIHLSWPHNQSWIHR